MNFTLKKALFDDCEEIQKFQQESFAQLLEKYQDFDISPATESLERIHYKFNEPQTTYYFIFCENVKIGVIRVVSIDENTMRISPMMILPQHQNKGYAQKAMLKIEELYSDIKCWQLDTIKQEEKLCYLYEKLGYCKIGKDEEIKQGMDIVYYQKLKLT